MTLHVYFHSLIPEGNNKNDTALSSSISRATLLELVVKNKW